MQRIHHLKEDDGMIYIDNPKDIFYLLGKKVSRGTILVFPEEAFFFVDSRYIDACKEVAGVTVMLDEKDSLDRFLKEKSPSKVKIDGKTCTFNQARRLEQILPGATFESHTTMEKMRAVKDPHEIEKMKISSKLNSEACRFAISKLREGATEKEIAWEYEKFAREKGGEELSFDTIVAFGENSAYPHYHTGDTKLKAGQAVLIDCGITVDSYTSDMTRSLFFKPEAAPADYDLWQSHFEIVKKSYDEAVAKAAKGVMFSELDEKVQKIAKETGTDAHIRHTLGHSLGLDVHEWPRITYKLPNVEIKEDMIFTIEPGLYFEGKWGIRYENTLWLSKDGIVTLSD